MSKVIAIMLALTLLAGCQSIFGSHAKLEVRPIGGEAAATTTIVSLEKGRQHLIRGEAGSAIAAFRLAALDPETAAPAQNGMGVAYALLGRGDLAERYFREAVAASPDDPRYAANLSKYYRSREAPLAKVEAAKPTLAATGGELSAELAELPPAVEHSIRAGPSTVRVSGHTLAAAVTRVSPQEIVIRTQPESARSGRADPRRHNPRFVAAKGALVVAYPVRLVIDEIAKR